MPVRPCLVALFEQYDDLSKSDPDTLTVVKNRALRFFQIEQQLASCPSKFRDARDRPTVWVKRLLALESLIAELHRMPRENCRRPRSDIPAIERQLADWVTYQRTPATRARHNDYQARRLECVPGFSWRPLYDRWQESYDQYSLFLQQHGRAPRYRSVDSDERRLAAWAAKQRWSHHRGTLANERWRKLSALSAWTWG